MTSKIYFPIGFLTILKKKGKQTANGLYMRWFVKPYLGIVGISPLQEKTENLGFRLFRSERTQIPDPTPIPIDTILPEEHPPSIKPHDKQNWIVFYNKNKKDVEVAFDLYKKYKNQIRYIRFNYQLRNGQRIKLRYITKRTSTQTETSHGVELHYKSLSEDLQPEELENLSYAIFVDYSDEYIKELEFSSNKTLLIGDFHYSSDNPFYIWSPAGGTGEWKEIRSTEYITSSNQLIKPENPENMVESMKTFYQKYYNKRPHLIQNGKSIAFLFPDLSQFPLIQPPLREYLAEEYEMLCKGDMNPDPNSGTRLLMPPQDAACMASTDPAIAHLMGLFRILRTHEGNRVNVYKIQGTWPDGKRFCIYSLCDYSRTLGIPEIKSLAATEQESNRTLKDYLTFRIHDRINVADLSWKTVPSNPAAQSISLEPVAYLILRSAAGSSFTECLSSFFIPREEADVTSTGKIHYIDWFEHYPQTDVNKVLDGNYKHTVGGFDIFGQLSNLNEDDVKVNPKKLNPGIIQKPEITLSKLPDPANPDSSDQIEIPIEIEKQGTSFQLKKYNTPYLKFDFSFFWPYTSRYIWDINRSTGNPSLDYFRLYYLIDTPFYSDATFTIASNTASGIEVDLDEIRDPLISSSHKNNQVFALLKKLGAINQNGVFLETKIKTMLTNGSFVLGTRRFTVASVKVFASQAKIRLLLRPEQKKDQDTASIFGFFFPILAIRYFGEQKGQLFWNTNAKEAGTRAGWKQLSAIGEEIHPTSTVDIDDTLVSTLTTPTTQIEMPQDLEPKVGVVCHPNPEEGDKDYHFIVKLPKANLLTKHHFQFIPLDPNSALEPGEHKKANPPVDIEVDTPLSVKTLFSEDRVLSFYAVRIADDPDQPEIALFRGEPIPFTSTTTSNSKEYLVYPDSKHTNWRIILPNLIEEKQLPLDSFLKNRTFNEDNYLTSTLTLAVEAVVTDQDPEVQDTLQNTFATTKLGFLQYLPPPPILVPEKPQPTFGINASKPDFNDISFIRLKTIYEDYELETHLNDNEEYVLYRLPADRIVQGGMPVEYDQDPDSDNNYRRNMLALTQSLSPLTGFENLQVAEMFKKYAEKVQDKPLPKSEFLKLPITQPGESRTVFLYAIKAYDKKAKKESQEFKALSPPVYVEDATQPPPPLIRSTAATLNSNSIEISIKVNRKLNPTDGYGFASDTELTTLNLLKENFPYFTKQYRLYLSNDTKIITDPDDSDFALITTQDPPIGNNQNLPNFDPTKFSLKLEPDLSPINEPQDEDSYVELTATINFEDTVDLTKIPSAIYISLRAENHLNQLSKLDFIPMTLAQKIV